MKKLLYVIFLVLSVSVFSQSSKETCKSPDDGGLDLNSITKCTVKTSKKKNNKKSRQIAVRVSAPKKRFLKKRKKQVASGASSVNSSGISTIQSAPAISNSVKLKTNLAALKNTLSKEEVRSAKKFSSVDVIPAFSSCNDEKEDQVECFNTQMIEHIQEHFRYPNQALLEKIEGEVWVRFIIDKEGNVTNIKALGPKGGDILKEEAIRVVSNLPKFTPGIKAGEKTSVKYGFPINFSLEAD